MQRMQRRAAQMMTTRLLHPRQMMRRHLRRKKPLRLKMALIRRCVSAASLSQLTQVLAEAFRCAHILEALLWVVSMTASVLVLCLRDKYTSPSNIFISTEAGILKCLLCTEVPVTGIILSRNLTWTFTSNVFSSTFSATDSSAIGAESHLRIRASSCTFNDEKVMDKPHSGGRRC